MHFRHKIATEALVYSFLLYQFQYMPKRVAFNMSLKAIKHLPGDHWGIYTWLCIHLWLFVPVFFLQLRCGCFS